MTASQPGSLLHDRRVWPGVAALVVNLGMLAWDISIPSHAWLRWLLSPLAVVGVGLSVWSIAVGIRRRRLDDFDPYMQRLASLGGADELRDPGDRPTR